MIRTIFTILSLLALQLASGQVKSPNTPAASVANYAKYSEIQPNLYTGSISIPIDIASVSEGPISLNVGLSYHTGGIRAHELSSTVGLGWSLNAGGAITREVRGNKRDEVGFRIQGNGVQQNPLPQNIIDGIKDGTIDAEADIYRFFFNGVAGQFTMDHTGQYHTIPQSDVRIEWKTIGNNQSTDCATGADQYYDCSIYNDYNSFFLITTPDGTKYYFGGDDNNETTDPEGASNAYVSSFNLFQIESADGFHKINIEYQNHEYIYFSLEDCSFYYSENSSCEMQASEIFVFSKVPKKISSSTCEISFDYAPRLDLAHLNASNNELAYRLDKIRVIEAGKTKTFDLSQNYFFDNSSNAIPAHLGLTANAYRRLKLNSISVTGSDGSSMPDYEFDYYGINGSANGNFFPSHVTQAIDHWGYYNGHQDNNDEDHIIPYTAVDDGSSNFVYGGETSISRETDFSAMIAGSLRQIKFPLGGTSTYTYEANTYWDDEGFSQLNFNQTIIDNDCLLSVENIQSSSSITVDSDMYNFGELILSVNPVCGSGSSTQTGFAQVDIIKGGVIVHTLNISDIQSNSVSDLLNTFLSIGDVFSLNIKANNASVNCQIISSFEGSNKTVGGLRVSSITTNDFNGNNIVRNFNYNLANDNAKSSGRLWRKPDYGTFISTIAPVDVLFHSRGVNNLRSFEGYHIGYQSVEIDYNGNGSKRVEFYTDTNNNEDDQAIDDFPPIPEQPRNYLGQLHKSKTYRDDGVLLQSSETDLDVLHNQAFPSVMYSVDRVPYSGGTDHYLQSYHINWGIYRPSVATNNTEGIISTTNYTYADINHLFATGVEEVDDASTEINESVIGYTPNHYNNSAKAYLGLRNVIIPFGRNVSINSKVFYQEVDDYGDFSGHYKLSEKTQKYYNGVSFVTDKIEDVTTFNNYNSKGLLTEMIPPGSAVSVTYDYHSNSTLKESCTGSLCTQFEYEGSNSSRLLAKKTNVDGTEVNYTYDALFRLKSSEDVCSQAVTNTTYHLFDSQKSYIKKISNYQADADGYSSLSSLEDRVYVDGLGRTIQTVGVGQAFSGNDQINAQEYDIQGRITKQYEIFESAGSTGNYVNPSGQDYTLTTFEASPLNRVSESLMPDWNSKSTKYTYGTNTAIITDANGQTWNSGTLFKRAVQDPDDKYSISYTDVRGRKILDRRADATLSTLSDTKYDYDDKNRVIEVIPPGSSLGQIQLNFYYQYDTEDKIIKKKSPSTDWVDQVYDDRDLLIGYQDGHFRSNGSSWYIYEYDDLGREINSGIHATQPTDGSTMPDDILTTNVYGTVGIELGKIISNSTRVLNTTNFLTSTHKYDSCGRPDYSTSSNISDPSTESDKITFGYDGAYNNIKTISETTDAYTQTNKTTITTNYQNIDDDGRVHADWFTFDWDGTATTIETKQLCELEYTARNQIETRFVGGDNSSHLQRVDCEYLANGMLHKVNGGQATGGDLFGYQLNYFDGLAGFDPGVDQYNGNIKSVVWQSVNDPIQHQSYTYDYLNRLKNVDYHELDNLSSTSSISLTDGIYDTEYNYDARGNFTSLKRYEPDNGIRVLLDDLSYTYPTNDNQIETVDDLGDVASGYIKRNNNVYQYDLNGNLTRDPQKGITTTYNHLNLAEQILWDDGKKIMFTYDALGNMLERTTFDALGVQQDSRQYLGNVEYINGYRYTIYHSEGRIVNEGLECFLNYLYLDHEQRQDGIFKSKIVESTGEIKEEYTQYKGTECVTLLPSFSADAKSDFLAHIIPVPSYDEDWRWEWNITDHLGNLRMVYADLNNDGAINANTEVIQKQDYYPYGLRRNAMNAVNLTDLYQYNGIEHVGDFGLNLNMAFYRNLDPALGSWTAADPKAAAAFGQSPYNSMNNNPISNIDPNGDSPILIGMGIGAILGGINGGWEGALKGAIAGGIGAGAGMAAVSAWGVGGVGFGAGAINGAIGGSVGGFAGGATGAWMNGASFGQGLKAGGIGAGIGGLSGGAIGGIASGVDAVKHGGNFWSGDGATYYSLATSGSSSTGNEIAYNNKSAMEFSNEYFGDIEGLNKLNANGTVPKGVGSSYKDGYIMNGNGQKTLGATQFIGGGKSNVYLAQKAFVSPEQLYLTMGHEYIHVAFNAAGLHGKVNSNQQHATIRQWEFLQASEFQHPSAGNLLRVYNKLGKYHNPVYNKFCFPIRCGGL